VDRQLVYPQTENQCLAFNFNPAWPSSTVLLTECSKANLLDIDVWWWGICNSALLQETLGLRICPLPYNTGVPSEASCNR
jgi:hypothetical protein